MYVYIYTYITFFIVIPSLCTTSCSQISDLRTLDSTIQREQYNCILWQCSGVFFFYFYYGVKYLYIVNAISTWFSSFLLDEIPFVSNNYLTIYVYRIVDRVIYVYLITVNNKDMR